jgi:hypothetical protein
MNFANFQRRRHAMPRTTLGACAALCVLLLYPMLAEASASSPEERYGEVRLNFEKGDFTRAQYLGEAMLKDGELSPQLFQLLGHIRYRQGDLGRASLWYSRAALFPPPVQEIRQNITHIHERTGNVRFTANTFRDQFSARLSRAQWLKVAIVSGWIFLFTVALYYFHTRSFALRTLLMLVRVIAVAVTTVALLGWVWHPSFEKLQKLAVVTAPGTKAYTAATVTSGSVSPLPPGSEVRKLEERGAWCYVEIPPPPVSADDSSDRQALRGWVQMESLSPYWPFDPAYLE